MKSTRLLAGLSIVIWSIVGLEVATWAPEIDEWLGWRTSADMRLVRKLPCGSRRLEECIAERYAAYEWAAFHNAGAVSRTTVECAVADRGGGGMVLAWEVGHDFSPHPRIACRTIFLCPLNRESVELTPSLKVPWMPIDLYESAPNESYRGSPGCPFVYGKMDMGAALRDRNFCDVAAADGDRRSW